HNSGSPEFEFELKTTVISSTKTTILRVVLESKKSRHSTLLLLDPVTNFAWFWDPRSAVAQPKLLAALQIFLQSFRNFKVVDMAQEKAVRQVPNIHNVNCEKSGYSVAYILKFVIDWLAEEPFDASE